MAGRRGRAAVALERDEGPGHGTGAAADPGSGPVLEVRNEVHLLGRVSGTPEERELPSGDALVAWRVVVERPAPKRPLPAGVRRPTVDALDCVAWTAAVRRTARGLQDGDVVSVQGALRRRFWRAGPTAVSRTEVEVLALRRVRRRA